MFDIGANTGQFASALRSVGYNGRIVSFEPLTKAFVQLTKNAQRDSQWNVAPRCAIGDSNGDVTINISGNSVSSSVLPMMESHAAAAEQSAYVGSERVPIFKLDTVGPEHLTDASRYLIKIDAQGFEWQVFDGAQAMLRGASGVLCELSLIPLYKGQRLWLDIVERLELEGFTLWSIQHGFSDPRDGRTLQVDGIFFRSGEISK